MKASVKTIENDLYQLNQYNSTPQEGTTRILFTEPELEARAFIKKRMVDNGLRVEEDAIGNIFGILEGSEPKMAPVWSGSHIDTVKHAGMFDGMAGVIAAIEALRMIKESGQHHRRSIKAIVYTSEEPTRFGVCCLGSRSMAGELDRDGLKTLYDEEGTSLEKVLEDLDYDLDTFGSIKRQQGEVHASVELHIEQGALLEQLDKTIGIVEGICGPTTLKITVIGTQEHAGSTPMPIRHDAMVAASEIIVALEAFVKETTSQHTVGTVGYLSVYPNVTNAIPGEVTFSIDLRDIYMETKESVLAKLDHLCADIESRRGVTIKKTTINHDIPVMSDGSINDTIEAICRENNIRYNRMVSGAYHDSMFVGKFAPMSMIFVPSKEGLSHNPKEWTDFEDIAKGTEVLAQTLYRLAK